MTTINQLHDLNGKVALITGGSRHLGFDAADVLAEAGCDLVITSRKIKNAIAPCKIKWNQRCAFNKSYASS